MNTTVVQFLKAVKESYTQSVVDLLITRLQSKDTITWDEACDLLYEATILKDIVK